ncbi:MAG: exonuclease/endonuclease/phosphatase family protein, partial [Planctomycetota bacterium]
ELAGVQLEIVRGWASVDLNVDGLDFRFVTTHLEPQHPDPTVQVDQAAELMTELTGWTRAGDPALPFILTGDINSAADGSDTPTYGNLIAAGLTDAWGPVRRGYTCCQPEDLLNFRPQLTRRVDVVLLHGDFGHVLPLRAAVFAWRVGHRVRDKTPSGLWPSDHAGVVAAMRLPGRR